MQIGHYYEISEMLSPKIKPFGTVLQITFAPPLFRCTCQVSQVVEVPSHQTCPSCFSRPPPSRPTTRPSCFSGVAEILEWAAPVSLLVDHLPVV